MNNFNENEYLIIQTYPLISSRTHRTIRIVYQTCDYQEAKSKCNLENLSHDIFTFATRIYYEGKLWIPEITSGMPYQISPQQFWEIDQSYNNDIIEFCECSYPYFRGDTFTETCLTDDKGRQIVTCPNCRQPIEQDKDYIDDLLIPLACNGCKNYHGEFYGDVQLICGIHPHGYDSDSCPDYE